MVILQHDDRRNIHNKMLCVNDNNNKKIEPVELQMVKDSKLSLTPMEREKEALQLCVKGNKQAPHLLQVDTQACQKGKEKKTKTTGTDEKIKKVRDRTTCSGISFTKSKHTTMTNSNN